MNFFGKNIFHKLIVIVLFGGNFACSQTLESNVEIADSAARPTVTSQNLEIKNYQNGLLSTKLTTPLVERYQLNEKPYMIFTKGIHVENYDSLGAIKTSLDALYAHYDETEKIWEAKGNVVARDSSGKTVYSQQIYLDEKKNRVYSNVDTKVVDGDEVTIGTGFESDDKLEVIKFKDTKGRIYVDTTKTENTDSLKIKSDSTKNSKK